jgi:hypothetical protein
MFFFKLDDIHMPYPGKVLFCIPVVHVKNFLLFQEILQKSFLFLDKIQSCGVLPKS